MKKAVLSVEESYALMHEVGPEAWMTYSALLMLSNQGGVCRLNQTKIAERVSCTARTIQRHVQKLQEVLVGEMPLVQVTKRFDGNHYRLTVVFIDKGDGLPPTCVVPGTFTGDEPDDTATAAEDDADSPYALLYYWREGYADSYGVGYRSRNYAADLNSVKTLAEHYGPELLRAIMDAVFRLYATKWKNQQFSRPTIGQLVTWLAAQAEPSASADLKDRQVSPEVSTEEDDLALLAEYERRGWL